MIPASHWDDVTFDLPSGYIMGLVGPNGAGKSTLIKLILNMTTRDAGRIEVLGLDAMADEERVKEQLGVVLDSSYFIEYMTVDAVERTSRPMYPLWDHNLFDAYLRRFGLGRNKKIKDLSRGMQMKLMLAVALSHDAKLLILDEPTAGLDVEARNEILDLLRDYAAEDENRTILITSHIASDLEHLCDDIYLIHGGKQLLHEETDVILEQYGLIKADEAQYAALDKEYLLGSRKEPYGYACLTNDRKYYEENVPGLVVERAGIDEVILMMTGGKRK